MIKITCDICGDIQQAQQGFDLPPRMHKLKGDEHNTFGGLIAEILKQKKETTSLDHVCQTCLKKIMGVAVEKALELIKKGRQDETNPDT